MIATTIQKILDKQELNEEERLELLYWFTRLQNAPAQLDTLFAGGAARITAASQITPNLGVMTAGKFVTPSSSATSTIPTEAGFTGSFMSGNGETFNGEVYNVGGVNAGQLQWGASQTDGALQAAEGLVFINDEGINFTSQGVMLNMAPSYPINRTGWILGGLGVSTPTQSLDVLGIHSFARNGAALIDDGFESGLGSWTQTGTPTLSTTYKASGSYSCQVDKNNYISKDISVTADNWYVISMKVRRTNQDSWISVLGHWYTYMENDAWTLIYLLHKATSTGTLTVTIKGVSGTNVLYVDDVYAYSTTVFAFSGSQFDNEDVYAIRASNKIFLGNNSTHNVIEVASTGLNVNSGLANLDTVIGGDTDAALLVTDASADKVGIGTATPSQKLDVAGSINVSTGNTYKVNGTTVLSGTVTGVTNGDSHDHNGGDGAAIPVGGISATGTPSATTFLRGDGTWSTPSGSGDMSKATYDTDNDGVVDNAELLQGNAASAFAVAAKGVTNGDSHDHNGGDGGTIAYSSLTGTPIAETNANDLYQTSSPGGASLWTGTISGAPSGTSVTVSAPTTGTEGVLVPASTSQLAKMRLYNLTRGTSALISNYNTGTNVITLTATVPAAWANGDSLTVASQTVSGGGFSWVDLEITSGPTGKSYMFVKYQVTSATVANTVRIHPTETFGTSKLDNVFAQVAGTTATAFGLIKIISNVFSLAWTGSITAGAVREAGYLS